jgi:SAM-dependent methyltransferase
VSDRSAIEARLGPRPSVAAIVQAELDEAFDEASARESSTGSADAAPDVDGRAGIAVLDAGCGRVSALRAYRPRIARFVGADLHAPVPGALAHLDEFAQVDLCADAGAFPPASFDVILSSFTVEHFADPAAAFRNMLGWLRPGGRLVITTVNKRHPFVRAYTAVPDALRGRLQRLVKETAADAHPIVAACNTVADLRAALTAAGYTDTRITTTGHLARAWGRHWPTRLLGRLGDLAAERVPSRRSTIIASAAAPG